MFDKISISRNLIGSHSEISMRPKKILFSNQQTLPVQKIETLKKV